MSLSSPTVAPLALAYTEESADPATSFINTIRHSQCRLVATDASRPTTKNSLKIIFVISGSWDHFDSHA